MGLLYLVPLLHHSRLRSRRRAEATRNRLLDTLSEAARARFRSYLCGVTRNVLREHREALRLDPDSAAVLLQRGVCLRNMGRLDCAVADLDAPPRRRAAR